ncbi:non-ribosomal peptide synthetase [Mesobacillus foraminis]|uniref:Fengycin family lipopeptide synthetase D n=1 Tax=Mesobacillus foraminis TaxID=279826 RepID=A0A4R2AUF9_9BACI|nr:non-ribosomal peptide synthetase [Mesobacillus foraminis]TCN17538.1 fengycin family lipopeptide synthetase D [Mesobacillus foraminis]
MFDRNNVKDMYRLSPMQQGMLFHTIKDEKSRAYFDQLSLDISGTVNTSCLKAGVNSLIEKYDVLRTLFLFEKVKRPMQVVLKTRKASVHFEDVSGLPDTQRSAYIQEFKEKDRERGFDLSRDLLIRFSLFKTGENTNVLLISSHHILMDGWCMEIILSDLFHYYHMYLKGLPVKIEKTIPYSSFIRWLDQQEDEKAKSFWKDYLHGFKELSGIPFREASPSSGFVREEFHFGLGETLTGRLEQLAKANQVTMNTLIQSFWGIMLQKLNDTRDVMFGSVVSGRPSEIQGVERIVGLFINTIPVRISSADGETLSGLIKRVQEGFMAAGNYDYLSLADIQQHGEASGALFDHIMAFENFPVNSIGPVDPAEREMGFTVTGMEAYEQTNYDFTIQFHAGDEIAGKITYNGAAYSKKFIEKIPAYLQTIGEVATGSPDIQISEISLTSEEEVRTLLERNCTSREYPKEKTVSQLFEEQAEKTPENVALVFEGEELTYRELNEYANRIARTLIKQGVRRGETVGLLTERSIERIAGMLGVLKSGAAYLPIDPGYPAERIQYILDDCGTQMVLLHGGVLPDTYEGKSLKVKEALAESDSSNPRRIPGPEDLAYIIYTSGSTGKPKGSLITHRNVIKTIINNGYLEVEEADRFLQLLNYAFDGSVFDIYASLLNGARLVLVPKDTVGDAIRLSRLIQEEQVTISLMTTALFNAMVDVDLESLKGLRKLMFGGEMVSVNHVRKALRVMGDHRLIHVYGPSEATVFATTHSITGKDFDLNTVPIGGPISNTSVYVLNSSGQLLPEGVPGELAIGGDGVSRGYLNRPELNKERFLENPFVPGDVIYRTGDLVRWLPDGNLEYLGRIDQQVKIRGHRIELGEVESRMKEFPAVQEAAATARMDSHGHSYLCAYIVWEGRATVALLRDYLREHLPDYMIPTRFASLDNLPLTPNGKVDKNQLPETQETHDHRHQKATTKLEKKLVGLYQEVLNREDIGILDNFFESGGHSLTLLMLGARIPKELNMEIPLRDLYANPTVKELAEHMESLEESTFVGISPAPERTLYPVSFAQKRMYLVQEIEGNDSTHYNMPIALEIKGELQKDKVEAILRSLIERHESLRTSFHLEGEEIVQKIHSHAHFHLEVIPSSGRNEPMLLREFVRPFNLQTGNLFRAALIERTNEDYILCLDMHHIISDGVSANLLFQEFISLYRGERLPELSIQYKDYSVWQHSEVQKQKIHEQEEFWMDRFSGEIPLLDLPSDFINQEEILSGGETLSLEMGSTLLKELKELSSREGTTLYTSLLASFHILLSKYTSQEEIVIGTPVSGRRHADLEGIVGMFVNTLAIRMKSNPALTFKEFLSNVKEESVLAFDHADYPFEMLVEKLNLHRDTNSTPLVQTIFTFQSEEPHGNGIPGLAITPYEWEWGNSKFDLTLAVTEGETLRVSVEYNTGKFKRDSITRLLDRLEWILEQVTKNPDILLSEIDIATPYEKRMVLEKFNATYRDTPFHKTITELFEEQVEKAPGNPAVVCKDEVITYEELHNRSNRLAKLLRDSGVTTETVVGVIMNQSIDMIVAILGILKSGGAYLPINPNLPVARQSYMLDDSLAGYLVVQTPNQIPESYRGTVFPLKHLSLAEGDSAASLEVTCDPTNLAYIIYTSGTTGKPKGVMVEHLSLVNLCLWHNHEFQVMPEDRSTKLAGFGFDASVWEIFPYLIAGSSIHIIEEDIRGDAEALNLYFERNGITISFLPTQLAEQFIPLGNRSLRMLLIGGEKVRRISRTPYRIFNNYGPTENTVVATYGELDADQTEHPIGRPIWNNQIFILDPSGNLLPAGIPGELHIAGKGLARGYMKNPALTEERFVENPFSGGKMYKTSDLGRWLPDGTIEFLGRRDDQVKIRGYRIELDEVEANLLHHPSIQDAVVLAHGDDREHPYLCAYVVTSNEVGYRDIRRFLLERIPEYMVPAYIIQIDSMPVNPNGKIDKKKLLDTPKISLKDSEYTAPQTFMEKKVEAIFKEVLKVERVGVHDNFFEQGGHSLNATILLSRIHKQLNAVIKLREFFASPTIQETAELIKKAKNAGNTSIPKAREMPFYPVSAAQKRMYIVEQLDAQNAGTHYNMPIVMDVAGKLSADKVEKAFRALIARHEALRTSFHLEDNSLNQVVHPEDVTWNLHIIKAEESEIRNLVKKFIMPFDLQHAPLFRAALVDVSPTRHLLMIDMHHIISDGVSTNLLLNDFIKLYQGHTLTPNFLQYKDYAVWQQEEEHREKLRAQEKYWLETLSGELPVLDLPADFTRPPVRQFKGETLEFSVDSSILKKLKRLSSSEGATLYMTLLAAYNVLLSKYTEKEDIIVGSPIAGRPHADLEEVVGVFVNVLALRNRPKGSLSFREFLANVRRETLNAYEHGDFPYEELVEKLDLVRDFSRNPIFDTTFSLQNFDFGMAEHEELQFKPFEIEWKSSKFDLSWICQEGEFLHISLEYNTSLFTQETINRMKNHFLHLLDQIVEDPGKRLDDMILVTEGEKHQLLYSFNETERPFEWNKTIHELFEEQVRKTPDLIAVAFGDKQLTYRELNAKANQLAWLLRERGTVREELVGIMLDRSPEMIVGILGVLKAGGAYVPIDPSYPLERICYILEDSGVQCLLTQKGVKVPDSYTGETILIDHPQLNSRVCENLDPVNAAEDLAYVIYTSGSTGKPKGVLIEHRGVSNFQLMAESYGIREGSRVLQFASYSFDASVEEIFHTLLAGGTLFICSKDQLLSGIEFIQYLEENSISTLTVPPSYLRALPFHELPALETLITAGEPCSKDLAAKWGRNRRFINAYGPTESTVCATLSDEVEEKVCIGRPIANKKIYILNPSGQLQPVGIPGELCIAGEGLARGYLNQPSLTAERFTDHPSLPGTRIYRTGDLARWQPDGTIEYIGRQDEQVKVRGYRIEIGEVETCLLNFPAVKDTKVISQEDSKGNTSLCAYVVMEGEMEAGGLRQYLSYKLPEFMIPDHFIQLDSLPVTSNGKVDKKRLPTPQKRSIGEDLFSVADPVEFRLLELWEEILEVPGIGVHENFFELGGQSLKGMLLVSRLQLEMKVKLSLNDLFLHPILKDLADCVRRRLNTAQVPVGAQGKDIGTMQSLPSYKIPAYVNQSSYTEEEILLGSGDTKIPATLTIPKTRGPVPVVVLIPGDGDVDRDSTLYALKPFKDIAVGLASRNIAVLRYEKRTSKRFKLFEEYTVSDEFYEDAVEAVQFLRESDKLATSDIFLVGHCRGGWLLPGILERKEMEGIAGGVVLSAPNPQISAFDMILQNELPGLSSEELMMCREQLRMLQCLPIDKLKKEEFMLAPSLEWWLSLKDYIPGESQKLKEIPFLVLQGGRDINVSADDFDKWKEVLSKNRNAAFGYFKKLNHGYVEGKGPANMEEYLLPGNVPDYVVEEIGNWIKAKISVVN